MSLEDTFIMEDVKSLSNSSEELNVNNEEQLPVYNHLLDSSGNILIPTRSESEENTEELPHLHSTDLQGCVQNIAQRLNPHKPTLITVANLNESQANIKIADPTQGQIKTKKSKSLENIPNSQKSEVINDARKYASSEYMFYSINIREYNFWYVTYILLLSSKAGGVGLNLIGGSRLILFDSDWNPATDLQAMARIWREGQKRPVYIYRLLTSGTIEEKIFQRQLSKAGLSESIVDPSATSNVKLSLEEMKDLFSYNGVDKCITHASLKCNCDGDGSIPLEVSPQLVEDREAELLPESTSSSSSLRMNQLYQWEHHAKPISSYVLKDMGLIDATEEINYIFKNKTQ